MLKSKAIDVVKTFSDEELRDFALFTRSPYFNTNKNIIKLFDRINTKAKLNSDDLTEEFLHEKIFPGKSYNYGIMKNLLSELYKLIEKFLIVNSSKQNDDYRFEGLMSLARVYDDRFLDGNFKKLISGLKEDLDNELIGFDRYHRYSLIEENIYYFNANRSNNKDLQDAVYNEMIYTICEFFRKFSRNLWKIDINIGNLNTHYEKDFIEILGSNINFDGLTDALDGIKKDDHDNIVMNTLLIKLLTEPDNVDSFFKLKKHLAKRIDDYTNYERYSIITKVLSYCASAFRKGKREFVKESLDIKKLMMKKVRFKEDGLGPFNYIAFIETVRAFLHIGRTREAENFLKNYSHTLENDKRDVARKLSLAFIEEDKGNYDEAIALLADIKPPDQDSKLLMKIVYLRAYFSAGYFEPAFSLINSTRIFINDSLRMDDNFKLNQLNTLKVFEKLMKIKSSPQNYSEFDINKIIEQVQNNFVLGATWFISKANDLKSIIKK